MLKGLACVLLLLTFQNFLPSLMFYLAYTQSQNPVLKITLLLVIATSLQIWKINKSSRFILADEVI